MKQKAVVSCLFIYRYLDINIYMPPYLRQLEDRFRRIVTKRVKRGRIEVILNVKIYNEDLEVKIDEKNVRTHTTALIKLIDAAGIKDMVRLSHLLRIED